MNRIIVSEMELRPDLTHNRILGEKNQHFMETIMPGFKNSGIIRNQVQLIHYLQKIADSQNIVKIENNFKAILTIVPTFYVPTTRNSGFSVSSIFENTICNR